MSIEPALHLHFEVSNRCNCRKCCPRVFRCCCCCGGDHDEYRVRKNGELQHAVNLTQHERAKANLRLYEQVIPEKVGQRTWSDIRGRVQELTEFDIDAEIERGEPVTADKIAKVAWAIQHILTEEMP